MEDTRKYFDYELAYEGYLKAKELFDHYLGNEGQFKKLSTVTMAFAYEDCVDYIQNKERQKIEKVEL